MKNGKELIIIILLSVIVRLPWLLMIPQAEAPDENMHVWVINYIATHCNLPDRQALSNSGLVSAYGSVPPFAYLPHIICLKLFTPDIQTPFNRQISLSQLVTRLGSLFMSLIVVAAAWWIGRKLFLDNRLAAIALPLLVAFHPQFVFVSSYANNDITTAAVSSLIIVNIVSVLDTGLKTATVFYLSLLLSWLTLSKYSGLHLLPVTCSFLPVGAFLHKQKMSVLFKYELGLLSCVALLTSWWFLRNYWQFDGDITGIKTMNHLWNLVYRSYTSPAPSILSILVSNSFWRMLFFSFWGWFGYMTHSLPKIIYYTYLFFVLVAAGLSINYLRSLKTTKKIPARAWTWLLFATCIILNLIMCAYCCCAQVSGPQGRYLFPSEIPIMSLIIGGLNCSAKKWSNKIVVALLIFNLAAYCYSTYFLYQLYCRT
jgi:hypothetical protein